MGFITTVLGLCFALVVTRSGFRYKRAIRALTVLPIITPPFVIGLALILLFGLSGSITVFFADLFGSAAHTLALWLARRADRADSGLHAHCLSGSDRRGRRRLTLDGGSVADPSRQPLADLQDGVAAADAPGLANAFLLGFIESMADFGNPLVLGGNFDVLSTEIFFAIVGAQYDQGRAAVLAMVLLFFTLSAFYAQRAWLGKKSYTTVTGKGDAGVHPLMPNGLAIPVLIVALGWALFTAVVYAMIIYGSVVELWGVNNTLTFKHYVTAFSVRFER